MDPRLRPAALSGDLTALNRALDDGADPNAADDDGYNPFRSLFVGILRRGTRLPADVIPKIVGYWAHLGWYEYSVPGTGSRVVATGPEESSSS